MHELSDNCNIFISLRLHALRKKLCMHKFQPFRRKTGSVLYIVYTLPSAWNTKIFPLTFPLARHKARSRKRKLIVRRKSFVKRLKRGGRFRCWRPWVTSKETYHAAGRSIIRRRVKINRGRPISRWANN